MIDPAFYSLSIVILRPGDLGLHFVQSNEVEVVTGEGHSSLPL